ncbi:MAG TPA: hypothetical protein VFD60_01205 [Nitrososphaeraceae archaeon]|nr:hypothetical protein [Nitrososphaeraceae archaeon]
MKVLVYQGPRDVQIDDKPRPEIQHPEDIIFQRELQIRMSQCSVKKYNEQLLHLIEVGHIDTTKIISQPMKLGQAPKGYKIFDKKEDVTKVVFKP